MRRKGAKSVGRRRKVTELEREVGRREVERKREREREGERVERGAESLEKGLTPVRRVFYLQIIERTVRKTKGRPVGSGIAYTPRYIPVLRLGLAAWRSHETTLGTVRGIALAAGHEISEK